MKPLLSGYFLPVPRLPLRLALFLSSFSPLFALMAYESRDLRVAFWILIGACAVGIGGLVLVMMVLSGEDRAAIEVDKILPKEGEVLSYIAVYLVPFLGVDLSKADDVVAFCAFLLVLGAVYVNSNMLFVNPLLSIASYHTFEIHDPHGNVFTVLTRQRNLDKGVTITPAQVDQYLRVDPTWRRGDFDETDGGT
jgi:hypothetical protein